MKHEEPITENLAIIVERTDELLSLCARVKNNNDILREENNALKHERDALREKTHIVHERVKKMINEIKELESRA
jgi:uncharacterized protein (TIGR02449 family)